MLSLLLLLLPACTDLAFLAGSLDDLSEPVVTQGWYLGTEAPEDLDAELPPATARAFLADASDVDSVPIEGATVTLRREDGTTRLEEEGDGAYGYEGLAYEADSDVILDIDGERSVVATAPGRPEAAIPERHLAGEPLPVSLAGQDFDSLVVTVIDVATGETVYESMPDDISGMIELSRGEGALSVEVPGAALQNVSAYAVGVAGLAGADELDGVNPMMSGMMVGMMRFWPMTTTP